MLFSTLPDGREVDEFTLTNSNGILVGILNYGGIIRFIRTPNRHGHFSDITLGFDDLQGYLNDNAMMGAVVGRYANRISNGVFQLDGETYQLDQNEGLNCLHGGSAGFNRVRWNASIDDRAEIPKLILQHVSPDGDQGFPGELKIQITYTLTDSNELSIEFEARSDKKTVVSLTMHPYFNLSDDHRATIGDHLLSIHADTFLPLRADSIPTGEKRAVANTPFDFQDEKLIGLDLVQDDEQLKIAGGLDHCFVFQPVAESITKMASVYHPTSGRTLDVFSTAPGLQLYTSNFLNDNIIGKSGLRYKKFNALCLEPQELPNAPNEAAFNFKTLNPGETYHHRISFRFSTRPQR